MVAGGLKAAGAGFFAAALAVGFGFEVVVDAVLFAFDGVGGC